jgi:hypothetical protein
MTLQIWILIAAVFVAEVLTRIGRHRYNRRQRVVTLAVMAVLAMRATLASNEQSPAIDHA